jgi:hypothetical protein
VKDYKGIWNEEGKGIKEEWKRNMKGRGNEQRNRNEERRRNANK